MRAGTGNSKYDPKTLDYIQGLLDLHRPATEKPNPTIEKEHTMDMETDEPSEESLRSADEIIRMLIDEEQGDYSAFRKEIALDIYENGHFLGNWDVSFIPDDYGNDELGGFRVIQEDEYDQHMDDDEDMPLFETMVGSVPNGYLWMN